MRALMIVTSLVSYFVNEVISKAMFGGKKDFDFEAPLTHLVWITSAVSIVVTFVASKLLLGDFTGRRGRNRICGGCFPPSSAAARSRAR